MFPWVGRFVWVFVFISIATIGRAETPCDGIDQSVSAQEKQAWAPIVVKRLNIILAQLHDTEHVSQVDFLKMFRSHDWAILYVEDYVTDETSLVYKGNPASGTYVTMDAGTLFISEEREYERKLLKRAPGIPPDLARCYVWYFAEGQ